MIKKELLFSIALMSIFSAQPLCAMFTSITKKAVRRIRQCTTRPSNIDSSTKITLPTKDRINTLLIQNGLRSFAEKTRIAEKCDGKESDPIDISINVFLSAVCYYSDLAQELQNPAIKEKSPYEQFPLILKTVLTDHPEIFKYIKTRDTNYLSRTKIEWENPYGNLGFNAYNYAKE